MVAHPPSRSLSRIEARIILGLEEEGRTELSLDDIETRASVGRPFARTLAHRLARKGWLQRLGGGRYLVNPSRHGPDSIADTDPFRVGSRLVKPYYFGYATAAELWGLLPQAGPVYYLVSTRRTSVAVPHAAQFRLVRVSPARFFGVTTVRRRGQSIRVSDRERTVLDCLDRPELSGGLGGAVAVLSSAKPHLAWGRLLRYVKRTGNRSLANRLGYLAERVRRSVRPPPAWIRQMLPGPGDPYVPLGLPGGHARRGTYDPRWHLIRNVADRELFSEAEVE